MDQSLMDFAAQPAPDMAKPTKTRSFSDPPATNALAPSPHIEEGLGGSRDDISALPPKLSNFRDLLSRGLSLRLPPPKVAPSAVTSPLSPQLTLAAPTFEHMSPATSIPRHSRGLDFSRASSTLHHTTTVQSSADSSPIVSQRPLAIPARRLSGAMMLDSPNTSGPRDVPWGSLMQERTGLSSSVGSVNMMGSGSESSDADEDASMGGDDEDPIFTTPQVHKLHNPIAATTPFQAPLTPGGSTWGTGSHFSPAQTSLMKTIRRARLPKTGKGRSRKSSSSASGSGYSSMASPRATSPPPMRSIETASGGYFAVANAVRSRRESLALGTDGLQLSSGNDSGDEASHTAPSTPGVVRRPVVRRGNLLPKTKGFARIRAALIEEAAPVDTETRREAETIRQVRERDNSVGDLDLPYDRPQTATAASSPNLLPAVPECAQEDFGRDLDTESSLGRGLGFGSNNAEGMHRMSGVPQYWNRFDPALRTPPPAVFNRQGSSMMSDINMDSPMGDFTTWRRPRARSSASDASEAFTPMGGAVPAGISDDMHLKQFKKRRREDDFDQDTIKRRAVSPGMSTAQNSPVLAHSPSARDSASMWGQPPERRDKAASISGEASSQTGRNGSNSGSTGTNSTNMVSQGKKLGLQPMADTNDGLMKMSIE